MNLAREANPSRLARYWVLAMVLGPLAADCGDYQRTQAQVSGIHEAERAIKPLTPAALHDTTRRHLAIRLQIVGDSLQFHPDSVSSRPGGAPFHPVGAGDFKVTFLNAADDTVPGGYTMEDPRTARSCREDGKGEVKFRRTGNVEILAPRDTAIAFVVVSYASGRVQRFRLGP